MTLPVYQIDTFTDRVLAGNPAAVVVLEQWPDRAVLQAVAAENGVPTTAFLIDERDRPALRWFTPTMEEELCGHATLAAAWLLFHRLRPGTRSVVFATRAGPLPVVLRDDETLEIDFPSRPPRPVEPHPLLLPALGNPRPREVLAGRDYLLVFDDAGMVRRIRPDFALLLGIDRPAVIVTAPGDNGFDCVSRFFAPAHGIDEDHATGAAHATVAPYWTERLGQWTIRAFQASPRGGVLHCRVSGDRVALAGACALYLEGTIHIGEAAPNLHTVVDNPRSPTL